MISIVAWNHMIWLYCSFSELLINEIIIIIKLCSTTSLHVCKLFPAFSRSSVCEWMYTATTWIPRLTVHSTCFYIAFICLLVLVSLYSTCFYIAFIYLLVIVSIYSTCFYMVFIYLLVIVSIHSTFFYMTFICLLVLVSILSSFNY